MLRQSVGWFEHDFAGRIANRIMQTPPAAGEVVFQAFDALSFSLAYLIGAAILLTTAEPRLLILLVIWFALYLTLTRWAIRRIGPASKAASDARSTVTGRVVDAYTNIHSVKMFAHHDREELYAKEAIEEARCTFQIEQLIFYRHGFLTGYAQRLAHCRRCWLCAGPLVPRAGECWYSRRRCDVDVAPQFNDCVDHVGAL